MYSCALSTLILSIVVVSIVSFDLKNVDLEALEVKDQAYSTYDPIEGVFTCNIKDFKIGDNLFMIYKRIYDTEFEVIGKYEENLPSRNGRSDSNRNGPDAYIRFTYSSTPRFTNNGVFFCIYRFTDPTLPVYYSKSADFIVYNDPEIPSMLNLYVDGSMMIARNTTYYKDNEDTLFTCQLSSLITTLEVELLVEGENVGGEPAHHYPAADSSSGDLEVRVTKVNYVVEGITDEKKPTKIVTCRFLNKDKVVVYTKTTLLKQHAKFTLQCTPETAKVDIGKSVNVTCTVEGIAAGKAFNPALVYMIHDSEHRITSKEGAIDFVKKREGKLSKVTFVFTNFKENHARNYTVEIDNSGLVVKSEFSLTKGRGKSRRTGNSSTVVSVSIATMFLALLFSV